MRNLLLIALMVVAVPVVASPYFPLVSGAIWTLADDDPAITTTMTMAGVVTWHGADCFPRYENVDGTLVGITYWSTDTDGRALMHGLEYLVGGGEEFYFTPPAVYLDPTLEAGESVINLVSVFEVEPQGDRWHGELSLRVACVDRNPVTTPLGTFPTVTVDPIWTDSPMSALWRYGHDGIFAFGFGVGPVRITSHISPEEQILVQLDNFVLTGAIPDAVVDQIELRVAPNPFNPTTRLRFDLAVAGPARLEIFDLRGRRLDNLHDGPLAAGRHEFSWQPRNLGSGIYLARVITHQGTSTTRLTLLE